MSVNLASKFDDQKLFGKNMDSTKKESEAMSKVAKLTLGIKEVKKSTAQMKKIWQKLFGSNWCSSWK